MPMTMTAVIRRERLRVLCFGTVLLVPCLLWVSQLLLHFHVKVAPAGNNFKDPGCSSFGEGNEREGKKIGRPWRGGEQGRPVRSAGEMFTVKMTCSG
jgi:hypothetical protein